MDFRPIQKRLGLVPDGIDGPKTYAAIFAKAGAAPALATALGRQAAVDFPRYGVSASALRIAHFMAQAGHETGGFRHMRELGSGDKNGDGLDDYLIYLDRRTDLGNTPALDGDGERYRGRGIFQITGTDNYRRAGTAIGVDLVANPEKAAEPAIAVTLACDYWQSRGISTLADRDDVLGVTRKINGGRNGLADRKARLAVIKRVLL